MEATGWFWVEGLADWVDLSGDLEDTGGVDWQVRGEGAAGRVVENGVFVIEEGWVHVWGGLGGRQVPIGRLLRFEVGCWDCCSP